jgi:hypothetical protein
MVSRTWGYNTSIGNLPLNSSSGKITWKWIIIITCKHMQAQTSRNRSRKEVYDSLSRYVAQSHQSKYPIVQRRSLPAQPESTGRITIAGATRCCRVCDAEKDSVAAKEPAQSQSQK